MEFYYFNVILCKSPIDVHVIYWADSRADCRPIVAYILHSYGFEFVCVISTFCTKSTKVIREIIRTHFSSTHCHRNMHEHGQKRRLPALFVLPPPPLNTAHAIMRSYPYGYFQDKRHKVHQTAYNYTYYIMLSVTPDVCFLEFKFAISLDRPLQHSDSRTTHIFYDILTIIL
jgi:hypothetical protein